jgi:hypothetical protein
MEPGDCDELCSLVLPLLHLFIIMDAQNGVEKDTEAGGSD